jgi:hypothetical protein
LREKDLFEDMGMEGRTLFKWILMSVDVCVGGGGGVEWINVAQNRDM